MKDENGKIILPDPDQDLWDNVMKELVKAGFDKYISFEQRQFKDYLYKAWKKAKPSEEAHLLEVEDFEAPTYDIVWKLVNLLQKWAYENDQNLK